MGLNTENFSEFNIDEKDFALYFSDELSKEESVGEEQMNDETKIVENAEQKTETKCEEPNQEEVKNADCENPTMVKNEDDNKPDEDGKEDMSFEECKSRLAEMAKKVEELESCNSAYMAKIDSMCDYEELKKFKADTEAKEARETEMAQMEKVMSDIENRGINMSDEDKKELIAKFSEFSSIEAWTNFAKAQVFDRVETVDGITRIGLSYGTEPKKSHGIWD